MQVGGKSGQMETETVAASRAAKGNMCQTTALETKTVLLA